MHGQLYTSEIKEKADQLRSQGKTYREIKEALGIPKSTLSGWVGKKFPNIFDKETQLKHLLAIRPLAIAAKKKIKKEQQHLLVQRVQNEILSYPLQNNGFYKAILSGLYWAEGSKHGKVSGLIFTNTDPRLAQFYIPGLLRPSRGDT